MRWFLALSVALATSNAGNAAVVEVTPKATAVLNMDFSPLDLQPALDGPLVQLPARAEPYLIQVDVSMRIYDLQPGQVGFSNTAFNAFAGEDSAVYFDVNLGIAAWNSHNPIFWPCAQFFCGHYPLWDINGDSGPNSNDLQAVVLAGITHEFSPLGIDPRLTLGQGNGDLAGTFF